MSLKKLEVFSQDSEKAKQTIIYSERQLAFLKALKDTNSTLSEMYCGCIIALKDSSNPDRFAQCAHSIRELMEKLPEVFDAPINTQGGNLKDKVHKLLEAYNLAEKNTTCYSVNEGWSGVLDGYIVQFFLAIKDFFKWFDESRPSRRSDLKALLKKMEKSAEDLPEGIVYNNIKKWENLRDFFQAVAHHRKFPEEREFLQNLDCLEQFLLDRLTPRTFDDFAEIDALIAEGEKNAK